MAVGKGGSSNTFWADVEREPGVFGDWWKYTIRSTSQQGHFFQARFKTMSDGRLRPAAIDHYDIDEFVAKGIPEALFDDIAKRSGRAVVSSRRDDDGGPRQIGEDDFDNVERRSRAADKMWRRLVAKGRARYETDEDRYVFIP